jgi:osmotically inducible protein OsmC
MERTATAAWSGDLTSGKGAMSTESDALDNLPFSFATRFEDTPGTNPEELIAAAHAGCFSMAFSHELAQAGLKPERVATTATVTLDKVEGGFAISAIQLDAEARVPGAEEAKVREIGDAAKAGCPVSKLVAVEVGLRLMVHV